MLNKQRGNMYPFVTHTWNPIRGKCPHECVYCYMKDKPVGELRLDEKALNDNLGEGKTIFVGSSTDMWAGKVPTEWIDQVLVSCKKMLNNTYLFQTKDTSRFHDFAYVMPLKAIFGTTIETNRHEYSVSRAPLPAFRIAFLASYYEPGEFFISIEPILDFDLNVMVDWFRYIEPSFVSIGADSKSHGLPEPDGGKIKELIIELKKFTEVKIKKNLNRLLKTPI